MVLLGRAVYEVWWICLCLASLIQCQQWLLWNWFGIFVELFLRVIASKIFLASQTLPLLLICIPCDVCRLETAKLAWTRVTLLKWVLLSFSISFVLIIYLFTYDHSLRSSLLGISSNTIFGWEYCFIICVMLLVASLRATSLEPHITRTSLGCKCSPLIL